ncbi:tripartite tricarboxylate transporter substrate-binding protein [Methylocella sp. CPCC 101449]|uniref:Bug family tripartite tricarboxylate transporter substrate binding protein n=1 Tax=Methylocella sp. CPCC 101449 TaxID=2987531 RepID=UPI0028901CB8|nr:tripartite tricarboxylate transporter substrate-binding protein [Methylocella sp. CPCC 101449]MDT2022316.1 tripartite tricarboxylate transporter substrate-binding protein [Methylocella sp. CPCC 101449]
MAKLLVLSTALFASFLTTASHAEEPSFAGKTISIYASGGGYALYARALAIHIGKRLPGTPTIIIRELPGAGTLMSANYIAEAARKDGTEIGAVGGSVATVQLYKVPNVRFDPRRLIWLASLASEAGVVAVTAKSGVSSIRDAFTHKILVGGGGPTSGNIVFPSILNGLLGTKFDIVRGYKSSEDIALAMERGEVEGVASWNWSSIKAARLDWVKSGQIKILLQLALTGHPDLEGIPLVTDLAKTDEQRAAIQLVFSSQDIARPYIAPPGTPPQIVDLWRRAFQETMTDPAFQADLGKMNLDSAGAKSGGEVEALIERLYATSPDVLSKVNRWMDLK